MRLIFNILSRIRIYFPLVSIRSTRDAGCERFFFRRNLLTIRDSPSGEAETLARLFLRSHLRFPPLPWPFSFIQDLIDKRYCPRRVIALYPYIGWDGRILFLYMPADEHVLHPKTLARIVGYSVSSLLLYALRAWSLLFFDRIVRNLDRTKLTSLRRLSISIFKWRNETRFCFVDNDASRIQSLRLIASFMDSFLSFNRSSILLLNRIDFLFLMGWLLNNWSSTAMIMQNYQR